MRGGAAASARPRRLNAATVVNYCVAAILMALVIAALVRVRGGMPDAVMIFVGMAVSLAIGLIFAAPGAPFWVRVACTIAVLCVVLNYGFGNMVLYFGPVGVPVTELFLIVMLPLILTWYHRPLFASTPIVLIILSSITVLTVQLVPSVIEHGVVAARDAMLWVDALFVVLGAAVALRAGSLDLWLRWRNRIAVLFVLGVMLVVAIAPFDELVREAGPAVFGYQQFVQAFGANISFQVVLLSSLMFVLLCSKSFSKNRTLATVIAVLFGLAMMVAILLFQYRTIYFSLFLFLVILALLRRTESWVFVAVGVLGAVGFLVAYLVGFEFSGRMGKVSAADLWAHIISVDGQSGNQAAAGGIGERLEWWAHGLAMWAAELKTVVFGVGFGIPLTDHVRINYEGDVLVTRDLHNSYISILVRGGLVAFVPWIIVQFTLASLCLRRYLAKRRFRPAQATWDLWILFFFASFWITALVEPVFELPWFAVPFWFVAGGYLMEGRLSGIQVRQPASRPAYNQQTQPRLAA